MVLDKETANRLIEALNRAARVLETSDTAARETMDATIYAARELKTQNTIGNELKREMELSRKEVEYVVKDLKMLRQEVGLSLSIKERNELERHNALMWCFLFLLEDEDIELLEEKATLNKKFEVLKLLKEVK